MPVGLQVFQSKKATFILFDINKFSILFNMLKIFNLFYA
jgi:hypothetical protein